MALTERIKEIKEKREKEQLLHLEELERAEKKFEAELKMFRNVAKDSEELNQLISAVGSILTEMKKNLDSAYQAEMRNDIPNVKLYSNSVINDIKKVSEMLKNAKHIISEGYTFDKILIKIMHDLKKLLEKTG